MIEEMEPIQSNTRKTDITHIQMNGNGDIPEAHFSFELIKALLFPCIEQDIIDAQVIDGQIVFRFALSKHSTFDGCEWFQAWDIWKRGNTAIVQCVRGIFGNALQEKGEKA